MRHHYVPQFLLAAWAEGAADWRLEVFRLDLPNLPTSRHAPRYTAFEDNLYALTRPVVAGMRQQAVETLVLRRVDEMAANVRRKMIAQGLASLAPDERMDWARFLMSLRVRQPAMVAYLRTEAEQGLRESLRSNPIDYEELAGRSDPPSLEVWTEDRFPGLIENFGLSFFHELVDNAEIGTLLMNMRWWLWDLSDQPHDLLLADDPCIISSAIRDPNVMLALPISPRKLFAATRGDDVAGTLRRLPRRTIAMRVNESSANQARVRIYSRDGSPRRFVENRLAHRRATEMQRNV